MSGRTPKPIKDGLHDDDYACTLDEIAAELGVTRQAVSQQLRRTLKKLRDAATLKEWCQP